MKLKLDEKLPSRLVDAFSRPGHDADAVSGERPAGL
jgi:predicted nuclease of predicted toxin-antitoxin system